VPRWPDDLGFVRAMMEQALATWRAEDDPEVASRTQHAVYLEERRRALAALSGRPLARAALRRRLARLRRFTWWREEMRDRSSYTYALVRRFTVEAGRRLGAAGALESPEYVFTLRHDEVLAALEGLLAPAEARRRARVGERVLRSDQRFHAPNAIGARQARGRTRPRRAARGCCAALAARRDARSEGRAWSGRSRTRSGWSPARCSWRPSRILAGRRSSHASRRS
jgi:hypothetical protein